MMCNGLVMIYMGPDGTDVDHMWGTLDGGGADGVANTLCQQLGYDDGYTNYEPFPNNDCPFRDEEVEE